jgi:copper chaperone CopZ
VEHVPPVKRPGLLVLGAAALFLGWIALRAEQPTWSAPPQEVLPDTVPATLSGEVPAGFVVRRLDVEGMCCTGCPKRLYAHLADVAGVREAAVDPILGEVAAVVPAELDVAELEAALTFDKYAAKRSE